MYFGARCFSRNILLNQIAAFVLSVFPFVFMQAFVLRVLSSSYVYLLYFMCIYCTLCVFVVPYVYLLYLMCI